MSQRRPTVRRQTAKHQTQALDNIIGSVELTILHQIYMTELQQNQKVTPQVAKSILDQFADFVTFDLAHVYSIVQKMPQDRPIKYEQLATWVKIQYLVYMRQTNPNSTQKRFEAMAQNILGEDNSKGVMTQLVSLLSGAQGKGNVLDAVVNSGIKVGDKSNQEQPIQQEIEIQIQTQPKIEMKVQQYQYGQEPLMISDSPVEQRGGLRFPEQGTVVIRKTIKQGPPGDLLNDIMDDFPNLDDSPDVQTRQVQFSNLPVQKQEIINLRPVENIENTTVVTKVIQQPQTVQRTINILPVEKPVNFNPYAVFSTPEFKERMQKVKEAGQDVTVTTKVIQQPQTVQRTINILPVEKPVNFNPYAVFSTPEFKERMQKVKEAGQDVTVTTKVIQQPQKTTFNILPVEKPINFNPYAVFATPEFKDRMQKLKQGNQEVTITTKVIQQPQTIQKTIHIQQPQTIQRTVHIVPVEKEINFNPYAVFSTPEFKERMRKKKQEQQNKLGSIPKIPENTGNQIKPEQRKPVRNVNPDQRKPVRNVNAEQRKPVRNVNAEQRKPVRNVNAEQRKPVRNVNAEQRKTFRNPNADQRKPVRNVNPQPKPTQKLIGNKPSSPPPQIPAQTPQQSAQARNKLENVSSGLMYLGPLSGLSLLAQQEKQAKKKAEPKPRKLRQILSPGHDQPEQYKPMVVTVKGQFGEPPHLLQAALKMEPKPKVKPPVYQSPYQNFCQGIEKILQPLQKARGRIEHLPTLQELSRGFYKIIEDYQPMIQTIKLKGVYQRIVKIIENQMANIRNLQGDPVRFYRKEIPLHQLKKVITSMIQQAETVRQDWMSQKINVEQINLHIKRMIEFIDLLTPLLKQAVTEKSEIQPNLLTILVLLQGDIQLLTKGYPLKPHQKQILTPIQSYCKKYIRTIPISAKTPQKSPQTQVKALLDQSIRQCYQLKPKRVRLGEDTDDVDQTIKKLEQKLGQLNENGTPDQSIDPRLARIRNLRIQTDFPRSVAQEIKNYQGLQQQRERLRHSPQEINQVLDPLRKKLAELTDQPPAVNMTRANYSQPPFDFDDALNESIKEFQKLRKQMRHNDQDLTDCDQVLKMFQKVLNRTKILKQKTKLPVTEEEYRMGLLDIFEFYARQPSLSDPAPKNQQLALNKLFIKIGKFISFCRDFGLNLKENRPGIKSINRKKLVNLFYQNADDDGSMYQDNFIICVDEVAQEYFDVEYDQIYKTELASLTFREKVILIYEFLECHDPLLYGKKMKGYGNPYYVGGAKRLREDTVSPPMEHLLSSPSGMMSSRLTPQSKAMRVLSPLNEKHSFRGKSSSGSRSNPTLKPIRQVLSPKSPQYWKSKQDLGSRLKSSTLNRAEKLQQASKRAEENYIRRINGNIQTKYAELSRIKRLNK